MPTRLHLKEGVGPQRAATVLRELVMIARNVPSASGGGRNCALRDAYLNWAETAESQLSGLTHDVAVVTMLQTPRFWQIRALDEASTRRGRSSKPRSSYKPMSSSVSRTISTNEYVA
jgi:hypothetical protein